MIQRAGIKGFFIESEQVWSSLRSDKNTNAKRLNHNYRIKAYGSVEVRFIDGKKKQHKNEKCVVSVSHGEGNCNGNSVRLHGDVAERKPLMKMKFTTRTSCVAI